jgi:regulatory protein
MSRDRLSGAMAVGGDAGSDGRVDAGLIEKWALDYLGRYASSAANLRRVLLRRVWRSMSATEAAPETAAMIDSLIVRYRAAGLIDDSLYAAAQVRSGMRRGQSLRTVRAKLAAKGVGANDSAEGIDAAIGARDAGSPDPDLAAACTFARRRRFGPFRLGPVDDEIRMRELSAFGRAGFERATAEAVLDCADPDAIAVLLEGDAD